MPRKGTLVSWLALIAGIGLPAGITALLGVAARGNRCTLLEHKQGVRALVWLNVWTAISFVAFFLGVGVHSAAVVFTLEASFAPLAVTTWAGFRLYRGAETG